MSALDFDLRFDAEPGAVVDVSPLVRRVLCGNASPYTFKGTSTFIVGRGKVAVVDPGPLEEAHLDALLHALRGETVTHILVTHSHADHSPLAARLQQVTGAATYGHGQITGADHGGLRLDASIDHDFAPDHTLRDGDMVEGEGWRLEAVFTPGHMSNHLCFGLREENVVFSGDHVMSWATSVIAPPDGHMGDYFASLRKMLGREDAVYHPGHGPSRADPLPLVRGLLAHRKMREGAILQRLRDGDRHVGDIVGRLYADVNPKLHGAAALSVTAHLNHLIEQGLVRRSEDAYEVA